MRFQKMGASVGIAVVLMSVIAIPAETQSTAGRIVLVRNGTSDFGPLYSRYFTGLLGQEASQYASANGVIVANRSPYRVRAVAVKWNKQSEVRQDEGRFTLVYQSPDRGSSYVSGISTVLEPGDMVLVTPEGYIPSSDKSESQSKAKRLEPHLVDASHRNPAVYRAGLDAVIFENGIATGKGTSGLFETYECQRNGPIEEALSLQNHRSFDSLQKQLYSDQAIAAQQAPGSVIQCGRERSAEAKRLLITLETRGLQPALDRVDRLASAQRSELRRPTRSK